MKRDDPKKVIDRRKERFRCIVDLTSGAIRGANGIRFLKPLPDDTPSIMGELTEHDGLVQATILGPAGKKLIKGMRRIIGRNGVFMPNTVRELAKLHECYPGNPQVHADFEDQTKTLGFWIAMPGTIEIVSSSRSNEAKVLPNHPKKRQRVTVKRTELLNEGSYMFIKELPVLSVCASDLSLVRMPNETMKTIAARWCEGILGCWKGDGFVSISRRDHLIDVAVKTYHITETEALSVLDFWIGREIFRLEDELVIPLAPMLSGASGRLIEKDFFHPVEGYHYVDIVIE